MQDIISSGLEGQEYVTVLSWIIQTYPGKELMSDPQLAIPKSKVKPLLDQKTIDRLQEQYLEVSQDRCGSGLQSLLSFSSSSMQNMHGNYSDWMRNTLAQEVEDWKREEDPDVDPEGSFHTSAPVIVYQMIDENLQVER